ncbi:unnamed protein product [Trifolium pratense]|uniref:Uncharacterized protein n=1 Tax=Trifolium pratense TaxID=57577 RepID=A0ACB0M506_TRIPR|nr:unnamed protein product [Trifolium pratense]
MGYSSSNVITSFLFLIIKGLHSSHVLASQFAGSIRFGASMCTILFSLQYGFNIEDHIAKELCTTRNPNPDSAKLIKILFGMRFFSDSSF